MLQLSSVVNKGAKELAWGFQALQDGSTKKEKSLVESVAWKQNPVPEFMSTNIVDKTSLSDRKMGKGKGKNCVQVKDEKDKVEEKRTRA